MKQKMRSRFPNALVLLADILITLVSIIAAFALRLEGDRVSDYIGSLYWMVLVGLLIKPLVYYLFGLYRRLWAYASINELTLIATAVSVASAIFSAVMLTLYVVRFHDTRIINFPRMVLPDRLAAFSGGNWRPALLFPPAGRRRAASKKAVPRKARNVLIIGAGDAGRIGGAGNAEEPATRLAPDRVSG